MAEVELIDYCSDMMTLRAPKPIAKISICDAISFTILDTMSFTKPTEEQIKNLHDLLCIDVELYD